ncbi:hypothetical protein MTO96_030428 [Rhipicephalus appendiculatus]
MSRSGPEREKSDMSRTLQLFTEYPEVRGFTEFWPRLFRATSLVSEPRLRSQTARGGRNLLCGVTHWERARRLK